MPPLLPLLQSDLCGDMGGLVLLSERRAGYKPYKKDNLWKTFPRGLPRWQRSDQGMIYTYGTTNTSVRYLTIVTTCIISYLYYFYYLSYRCALSDHYNLYVISSFCTLYALWYLCAYSVHYSYYTLYTFYSFCAFSYFSYFSYFYVFTNHIDLCYYSSVAYLCNL